MTTAPAVLRCPRLVGRTNEFDALLSAIDRGCRGDGAAVLVTGPAGVGKSRLVAEAVAVARTRGCAVLSAQCSPLRRATPLGALIEAFLPATRQLEAPAEGPLAPFATVLGRIVAQWLPPMTADLADSSPLAIGEGVCRLLGTVGAARPAVVVIEDLHWSDDDSLQVLAYAARHLADTPATLILTSREAEPDSPAALGDLFTAGLDALDVIEVGPLDRDAVAAMAAACLGVPEAPAAVVDRLQTDAAGLPLLVEDLVAAAPGQGPRRFAEVVGSRMASLPEPARQVIELAAVSGDAVDPEVLGATGLFERSTITAALHQGAARQLLVSDGHIMRFRHALTAQIIRDALAPTTRRDLAGRVARALEQAEPPDLAAAAELWLVTGEPRAAAACQLSAAREAASQGSLTIAEQCYRDALKNGDPAATASRREIIGELLDVLVAAGRYEQVVHDGGAALDLTPPTSDDSTRVHLLLAQAYQHSGDRDSAATHLDAARRNRSTDPGILARLRLTEAQHALSAPRHERLDTSRHLAAQAIGLAEAAGDHALTCEALEVVALCERDRSLTDAVVPLERILDLAERHHLGLWKLRALNEIGAIEVLRDASGDRLLRARALAVELGAPGTLASIEVNLAALHVMCGRTADAYAAAVACRDLAEPLGIVPLVAASVMLIGVAHGYEGDFAGMDRELRAAEQLAAGDTDMLALAWAAGRGITALVREDRDDARRSFEHANRFPAPARTLNPARGPLLLLAAVQGENVREDITIASDACSPDARYPHMWLGFAGAVTLGAARQHDQATEAFAVADTLARPYRLFRAVALRLVAEAALRDGWGNPTAWLRDAETEFVARSLPRIASACRSLLKQAGEPATRRRGVDNAVPVDLLAVGITAREAEVLDLVAQRLTNKEIAERLYLSPRTVEKHVANLLTKTTCADRNDLAFYARHR